MNSSPTLYLVSNSPGEVSTFVRPFVAEVRKHHPQWPIQVCLVPCPYATGAETRVITSWPDPPEVWTPWQTTKAWWRGQERGKRGVVVFLGGDPWHALLLKSRFKMPSLAYFPEPSGWEKTKWLGGFDSVAVGYRSGETGPNRIAVGDLRVDAVRNAIADHAVSKPSKTTLALFPGSRWLQLKALLGSFLKVVDDVMTDELEVLLAASPFVSPESLANAAANPWKWGVAQVRSELRGDVLVTENGSTIQVVWGRPYEVVARCDLALSIPGTNTAELAIAGKPTVVPLSAKAPVGGGGLLGILERLPGMELLKRHLRLRKKERLKLVALPNQLAGRMVMPEFIVQDDLLDLSDFMGELINDEQRRESIGREAQEVMGPAGAARRLLDVAEGLLGV